MAAASKAIDDGCDPRFVLMMGRWRNWHILDAFYNHAGCRIEPKPSRQAAQELLAAGSLNEAKSKGQLRSEGKDYVVAEGDVMEFLFNV